VDLELYRRFFAEEVATVVHLRTAALAAAFARVPRERFVGPGPWQIMSVGESPAGPVYWTTPDADPRRVYHDVMIALDAARQINNGQPSAVGRWLDALDLAPGMSVLHVGCGAGYYSAIAAEAVGETGRVVAVEIDADLAARARANLADRGNVEVVTGNGGEVASGPFDAIFVNAGATHPRPLWLDGLGPGGRLVLPLTFAADGARFGVGYMLRVERASRSGDEVLAARFFSPVSIYPCAGARDAELNGKLHDAYTSGTAGKVVALSRAAHEPGDACWLHGDGFCLQTGAPPH